jgi:hypothetical protein
MSDLDLKQARRDLKDAVDRISAFCEGILTDDREFVAEHGCYPISPYPKDDPKYAKLIASRARAAEALRKAEADRDSAIARGALGPPGEPHGGRTLEFVEDGDDVKIIFRDAVRRGDLPEETIEAIRTEALNMAAKVKDDPPGT